jgi:hypothetical protein
MFRGPRTQPCAASRASNRRSDHGGGGGLQYPAFWVNVPAMGLDDIPVDSVPEHIRILERPDLPPHRVEAARA